MCSYCQLKSVYFPILFLQQSEYDEEKINTLKMSQDLINHLLAALLNFSDLHDEFCLACSEAGIVQLFVDMTKDLQDSVSYHVKFVVGTCINMWQQIPRFLKPKNFKGKHEVPENTHTFPTPLEIQVKPRTFL